MTESKRINKSKFVAINMSDMLDDSDFVKNVPKTKRVLKRQKAEIADSEDIVNLMGMYKEMAKKKKDDKNVDANPARQKLLEVLGQQMDARKNVRDTFMKSLLDIISQMETDNEMMKENELKLEHLTSVFLKSIKQSNAAQNQNLKALKDLKGLFKKECEQIESEHKTETGKLADELEEDMNKLQQQLIAETKRKQFESLRRSIFHAIQNDLVEGLLTRGAMKPDDRPLWFDVYRAFPPAVEPKFARPKPEIKPIREILYHEDVVREKFHSQGHGLGAVNMLNPTGETHSKRLLKQYEKLKSEGVPESELVEKSVAAEGLEQEARKHENPNISPKNPDSVTAQVMKGTDLKNIFKE